MEQGIRLLGAAEALLEPLGVGLSAGDQHDYERDLAFIRGLLDEETFQRYWNEGRTLSLAQALALVSLNSP